MNFCVNGRQPYSVIKKADEIKFSYNDKGKIFDLIKDYSDKTIILELADQEMKLERWKTYEENFTGFYIALQNLWRVPILNENGIKWYWPYPITSYYELRKILEYGPSYIMVGAPLSFDLETVKSIAKEIPLRMVANVARPSFLPDFSNSPNICGQWVRPEDCEQYSEFIHCLEFGEVDLKREAALLKVYKEDKSWPGNLNLLINRLNFDVNNLVIPDGVPAARLTCRQVCQSDGICRLCINGFQFAEQIRKERERRSQKASIDNN